MIICIISFQINDIYTLCCIYSDGNSQYCCYKEDGELLVGCGGGSAHYSTPNDRDAASIAKHHMNDLQPFIYCCKSNNCDLYFSKRPSDEGNDYVNPPPPGLSLSPQNNSKQNYIPCTLFFMYVCMYIYSLCVW